MKEDIPIVQNAEINGEQAYAIHLGSGSMVFQRKGTGKSTDNQLSDYEEVIIKLCQHILGKEKPL